MQFKTVNELKRNLPEALDRIVYLRKHITQLQMLILDSINKCNKEAVTGIDQGIETEEWYYDLLWERLERDEKELDYLKDKVNCLKNYKHYYI